MSGLDDGKMVLIVGVWHVAPVNPLPHEQLNAFGNCWACAQMFATQLAEAEYRFDP